MFDRRVEAELFQLLDYEKSFSFLVMVSERECLEAQGQPVYE